jgi:1-acyl-sn-glycerol-3-phosphate acyltransferase
MGRLRYVPRTIATGVVAAAATLLAAFAALAVARVRPTSRLIERITDSWSRAWLWAAGVRFSVVGAENVDPHRSYVVVANHASALDIMACFLALPIPIRFLAKRELFRIPLLASAMRAIGIVEVDRQARAPVHDQINLQARGLIATGRSVIIYPEGTRTRDGSLGAFKKGAFTIAVRSGWPVLPVTIHGSFAAWPPGSPFVRGGKITVAIDPPLETESLGQGSTGELRDTVHAIIEKRLDQLSQS